MQVCDTFDLRDLLERAITDGFTAEMIGKAINLPVEMISHFRTCEFFTIEERQKFSYLGVFLMNLYADTPDRKDYLKSVVDGLRWYFAMPASTLEKYLRLEGGELSIYLEKPDAYPNGFQVTLRLLNLRNALLQEKGIQNRTLLLYVIFHEVALA